ncbi:MAG: hypothetical protein GX780_06805 [Campylobacteraceae bacterium]|nr:hypothetical protein [Campylobacteraceae bacterium]
MKIESYGVQMSAQYYNLEFQSTNSKIIKDSQTFEKDSELSVSDIDLGSKNIESSNKLQVELSKAILQSISSKSSGLARKQTSLESQGLNFEVSAKVVVDGKEMDFSLNLELSRTFVQTTYLSSGEIAAILKDPLVISLDGAMPSLSSKKFSFDIDSDGTSDQVSLLKSGSAFLALDRNNNGKIDDGSELFGTKSGDGFADLSKYDDDNNGWIDANDKIFDKLRIWVKTDTKDELLGLGEVGIGAIFLGNANTPFSMKSNTNELLGEMRKSGIVLFNNGRAGIVSQIDLTVETKEGLTKLEHLQKSLSLLGGAKIYTRNQRGELKTDEDDDILTRLQKKIKILEAKLSSANSNEKASIQTQISLLQTQIMSLI